MRKKSPAISILLLCVALLASCGGSEENTSLSLHIDLPEGWESLIDMEVLGAPVSTPYVGSIRVVVENGIETNTWEFPWEDRVGTTGKADLSGASVVRVQAVTAGTVIMEESLTGVQGPDVSVTLKESGGFSAAGSLLYYREDHSAIAVGDTIIVIGGNLSTGVIEAVAPSGKVFSASAYAASLVYPRKGQEVLHDTGTGRLFVFKGGMPAVEDNLFEVIDLGMIQASPFLLSFPRYDFTPVIDFGILFLLGGENENSNWQEDTLLINAQNLNEQIWTAMGSSIVKRDPLCVIESEKIACFGGSSDFVEVFDIVTGNLDYSEGILPVISGFSAVPLQTGEVLLCGGIEGTTANNYVKNYNIFNGEIFDVGSGLIHSRYFHSVTYLSPTKVLILGGGPTQETSQSAEILDLTTGKSTELPWRMRVPRAGHTATLLPDGRVLVIGGNMGDKTIEVWNPPTEFP